MDELMRWHALDLTTDRVVLVIGEDHKGFDVLDMFGNERRRYAGELLPLRDDELFTVMTENYIERTLDDLPKRKLKRS